jgi:hypothetical protein
MELGDDNRDARYVGGMALDILPRKAVREEAERNECNTRHYENP